MAGLYEGLDGVSSGVASVHIGDKDEASSCGAAAASLEEQSGGARRRVHGLPNFSKSHKKSSSVSSTPVSRNSKNKAEGRQPVHFQTMEITMKPEEILKMVRENRSSSNASTTPKQLPRSRPTNALIESVMNGTPRPKRPERFSHHRSDSPSLMPSFSPNSLCSSTPSYRRSKDIETGDNILLQSKDQLGEDDMEHIGDAVNKAVICWYEMGLEWQLLKKTATKHLEKFISEKHKALSDPHCQGLNILAVTEAVCVGDQLKSMSLLTSEFQNFIKKLESSSLGLSEKLFSEVIPFTTMPLGTIVSHLKTAHTLYRKEYVGKKAACQDLMSACGVQVQGDECINLLNTILSVWTTDIHIDKKDPILRALLQEVIDE